MGLRNRLYETSQNARESADRNSVSHWRQRLLSEVNLDDLAKLSMQQRRIRLEKVVGHLLSREGPVLSDRERSALIRRVVDEALGLGVLEPLLADDSVTEIMVNGPDDIYVERAGRVEKITTTFANENQLMQTIDRIVSQVNRRVDESSPMVDARLPSGERVNVIIPPLALTGPTITIRRFPKPFTIKQLAAKGSLDEHTAALLAAFVRARFNIIIAGGTGSGKTTFLNALSAFAPNSERIITIEDSAELQLQQDHVIRLESRPPNMEGAGQVTIRDLVRNSLRMRPDRIIIGEVRGAETLDMLQAMNTGHDGSLATVHANSADDAVYRLLTLASMSEVKIPFEAIQDQINAAVDVIVHLSRYADGSRRVGEIGVVTSSRREAFKLSPVLRFEAQPLGPDGRVHGEFHRFPLLDHIAQRVTNAGETIPPVFTGAPTRTPLGAAP
ncbi:CpaF family protein [Nocardiopsis composta]|uniref:Pilus assembly protein CpaF n=1 Tax=Nocardiopsis composta TaxID=157465 RepID=A0A7W8VDR6_9ACTN|nr:CpaF family protein [Nocardiopsis composta]MBB5432325.1 pilus assembly protein CpaF [Nocardiopsis composta]